MLGNTAPAPFKKDSLAQDLPWDGKDDAGQPAIEPLKVRVGLGLKADFDKIIGWSGQDIADEVRGLVCGSDGKLYVFYGGLLYAHRITTLISAFDREGRYLHQVFPGPANLPAEKRKGWPRVQTDDGREVPVVAHLLSRSLCPGMVFGNRVLPATTTDGRLVMLSGAEVGTLVKDADVRGGRRLVILGGDGSMSADCFGPEVAPANYGGFGAVALSPDDKFAYVTGLFEAKKAKEVSLCNVVWRLPLDGSAKPEVFVGKLFGTGAGGDGLDDPQSLAVDKAGNVYVSDYGNKRVAIFKPDGSLLGELPVENPDTVRVSRKTGAIYVMCLTPRKYPAGHALWYNAGHNWQADRIVRFDSPADKQPKATLDGLVVPRWGGGAFMALDDSGPQATL